MISVNPQNKPTTWVLLLSPTQGWRLVKTKASTQDHAVSDGTRTHTQAYLMPKLRLFIITLYDLQLKRIKNNKIKFLEESQVSTLPTATLQDCSLRSNPTGYGFLPLCSWGTKQISQMSPCSLTKTHHALTDKTKRPLQIRAELATRPSRPSHFFCILLAAYLGSLGACVAGTWVHWVLGDPGCNTSSQWLRPAYLGFFLSWHVRESAVLTSFSQERNSRHQPTTAESQDISQG